MRVPICSGEGVFWGRSLRKISRENPKEGDQLTNRPMHMAEIGGIYYYLFPR